MFGSADFGECLRLQKDCCSQRSPSRFQRREVWPLKHAVLQVIPQQRLNEELLSEQTLQPKNNPNLQELTPFLMKTSDLSPGSGADSLYLSGLLQTDAEQKLDPSSLGGCTGSAGRAGVAVLIVMGGMSH